jgi:hypothetical protein
MMKRGSTVILYYVSGGIQCYYDTFSRGVKLSNRRYIFSITSLKESHLYVVRWTNSSTFLDVKKPYKFLLFWEFVCYCLFGVKIIGLSSLEIPFPF